MARRSPHLGLDTRLRGYDGCVAGYDGCVAGYDGSCMAGYDGIWRVWLLCGGYGVCTVGMVVM